MEAKTKVKPKTVSISKTLRGIPVSYRATISCAMTGLLRKHGFWQPGDGAKPMTDKIRELLAAVIFEVENELEHRKSGQPDNLAVVAMRDARNLLYDDLGWNDA